ncbi:TrkH-domain-containing protein, partial [Aureobasidium melanogenum]
MCNEKVKPLGRVSAQIRTLFDRHVRPSLPAASFINLHYLYFGATCLLASIIFWGSSTPPRSVSYIDSLFLCISAMTEAGLNTVNLSTLNTWQQVILFLLIIIGSAIWVSIGVLYVRKRAFERKFAELAARRRKRLQRPRSFNFSFSKRKTSMSDADHVAAVASGAVRGRAIPNDQADHEHKRSDSLSHYRSPSDERLRMSKTATRTDEGDNPERAGHIRFRADVAVGDHADYLPHPIRRHRTSFLEGSGVGAKGLDNHPRNARPVDYYKDHADESEVDGEFLSRSRKPINKYLDTVNGYLGRNSQFHHLSDKERKKLGGIEYDAICLLSWVVPVYFVLFQLLGALGVGAWIKVNRPGMSLKNGLDPFWTGAFFAISAFNNSGMALLDANATAVQTSYYVLLTLSLLILAGNTCFPPFLRLVLWTMKNLIPKSWNSAEWQVRRRTLEFCLDHPRRVYTNLFPKAQTWWLVFSVVMLNGIDWLAFELLNIGNPTTDSIPAHFRVLDGLFQAFAVRSGGFYVVSIAGLRSGLLVLYVLMMYISAFPVTMTIRNTNVYEERSLGLYAEDLPISPHPQTAENGASDEKAAARPRSKNKLLHGLKKTMTMTHGQSISSPMNKATFPTSWTRQDFVRQQLRSQLGHDLWWIALAIFVITSIETGQFERDPVVFSTFNIIFEVTSAYGCVGISTGVPWNAYSFCGAWHTASKLVLCAVMLRGRHRGLPVSIDRAILLPDESLAWAEEEDAHKRRASFHSTTAAATATGLGMVPSRPSMSTREGLTRPRTASFGAPGPSVRQETERDVGDMV